MIERRAWTTLSFNTESSKRNSEKRHAHVDVNSDRSATITA